MIKKYLQITITAIIVNMFAASMVMAATDDLIPKIIPPKQDSQFLLNPSKVTLVKQLPTNTFAELIASIIKIILAVTGSLAFASFTVGGILMVTARGNDDQIAKGKKILLMSIAALAIIAASYGIVIGITQLNFLQ